MSAMELQLCLNKGQEVVKTIAKQVVIALVLVKWNRKHRYCFSFNEYYFSFTIADCVGRERVSQTKS
jgi:hypothetical protein